VLEDPQEPAPRGGPRVFFMAGEVSGDVQAAYLARALQERLPGADLVGLGGPRMAEAGVRVLQDTSGWGVVGYLEAYVRVPVFAVRLQRVLTLVRRTNPDLLVLVDFPGFNVFVARALSRSVRTAYYFPPMAYGRRGRRAAALARLPVRVLVTFPFELDAYQREGADVVFVGHPAVDLTKPHQSREELCRELGLDPHRPLIALLPGSRAQEVRTLLPVQLRAYELLRRRRPQLQAAVALASQRLRPLAAVPLQGASVPAATGLTHDLLAHADCALVASGTATLEAALLGTPMVVVYRVSKATEWIARRVATVHWVSLPNLLAGRVVVPELLQEQVRPDRVAEAAWPLLADPERAARMREDLLEVRERLGPPGAVQRAADELVRWAGFGPDGGHGVP
jgi:lipid-A-disaccharide synthase